MTYKDRFFRDPNKNIFTEADAHQQGLKKVALVGGGCFLVFFAIFFMIIVGFFWKIATYDYEGARQDFITECHDRGWHVAYQAGGQMVCQEPGINVGVPQ